MTIGASITVPWVTSVPNGWANKRLSWLFAEVGSGTTPPTDVGDFYGDEIPWVTTGELRETEITETQIGLTLKALAAFPTLRLYPAGTVIIAMYGATIGRLGTLGVAAATNQACCAFSRPVDVEPRYIFHWLQSFRTELVSLASGGGQPNINQEKLRQLRIPVPDLDTQKVIASFLDRETARIDHLIEKKRSFLALIEEKRASLIERAVNGSILPQSDQAGIKGWFGKLPSSWAVRRGRFLFRERQQRSVDGSEELLTVSHITGVTTRADKDVNMFLAESLEGYKVVKAGDVVVNTMWAWMGAMGVSDLEGVASPSYGVYGPTCDEFDRRFLDLLLRSKPFVAEVNRRSKGIWASRLRLYADAFLDIVFPIPLRATQNAIMSKLSEATATEEHIAALSRGSIERLRELRSALITAAVTGQIDLASWDKRGEMDRCIGDTQESLA